VPGILRLDLLATDFYRDKAYPTYLYYNPYQEARKVTVAVKTDSPIDVYNSVSGAFLARNARTDVQITIAPRQSAVLVFVPSSGKTSYEGKKMLVDGVVVSYAK